MSTDWRARFRDLRDSGRLEQLRKELSEKTRPPSFIEKMFAEIDDRHFSGRLRAAGWRIEMRDDLVRRDGLTGRTCEHRVIALDRGLLRLRDRAAPRRTLLHECVHAWLMLVDITEHGHDLWFQAELERVCAGEPFAKRELGQARDAWRREQREAAALQSRVETLLRRPAIRQREG